MPKTKAADEARKQLTRTLIIDLEKRRSEITRDILHAKADIKRIAQRQKDNKVLLHETFRLIHELRLSIGDR